MTWMATYEGIAFDVAEPSPRDVREKDISWPLSGIQRFNGHTKVDSYSVAEHLLHAERVVQIYTDNPLDLLHVLLHDAHEAYTGDITSPVKAAIGGQVSPAQERIQRCIERALCLPPPSKRQRAIVRFADLMMLEMERTTIMHHCSRPWGVPDDALEAARASAFEGVSFERSAYADAAGRLAHAFPFKPETTRADVESAFLRRLRVLRDSAGEAGYLL